MSNSDDQNRIEELKNALYSRNAPEVRTRRKLRFSEEESAVPTEWEKKPEVVEPVVLNDKYENHSMSFFTKLLIGSFIFCLLAVGAGAYIFFKGANLISGDNIDITINGPVSIAGGEVVPFDIKVKNLNNIALENADLLVEYPAGTTDPEDPTKELRMFREMMGDIEPGKSAEKTVRAIIFGEENAKRQLQVTVTYKVKGSTSLFTKKKTYDVIINSSPVSLSVTSIKEVSSGQDFEMKVNIKSNSEQDLKSVLLKAQYPFGFTFTSSKPEAVIDNMTWKIGDIPAGSSRDVTIKGKLVGEDTDKRIFRFAVGAQSSKDAKLIGSQFMSTDHALTIEKPFVSLGIVVDGNDDEIGDHIAKFGESKRIQVRWVNNLPHAVTNAQIMVKLSGSAYDKNSVRVNDGYYRSASNDIIWNQQTTPELASIPAGGSGNVDFVIYPTNKGTASVPIVNPKLTIIAGVSADRTSESRVPLSISNGAEKTIRVSSDIALSGRVVRTIGAFQNTGPIPPRAEQATTYTIIWTVDNTANTVSNAVVTASLPAHVKWLGKISPSTEDVTYNTNNGQITWRIGNVETYTLNSSRRRELQFQVSITPSVTHVNSSPTLVNQAILTGKDVFTGSVLESSQEYLTTRFGTDPSYREGNELVDR